MQINKNLKESNLKLNESLKSLLQFSKKMMDVLNGFFF